MAWNNSPPNYPNGLDNQELSGNPAYLHIPSDQANFVDYIARLRNSIIAIESELGVKPAGVYGSVSDRLDQIVAGSSNEDGYSDSLFVVDVTQTANFSGSIAVGEPLTLTSGGLVKSRADAIGFQYVYGTVAVANANVVPGTLIPVVVSGFATIAGATFTKGQTVYLAATGGVTTDAATLAAADGVYIVKIGTATDTTQIMVEIEEPILNSAGGWYNP